MNTRGRSDNQAAPISRGKDFRPAALTPLAQAIALMLAAGGLIGNVHAAQPFSAGWYASKGALQDTARTTGMVNGKAAASFSTPAAQQQQASAQLQQSIANLSLAAHGIAMMQAQQAAWRQAALGNPSSMPAIPDGLGAGGLDAGSLASSWINAKAPKQTTGLNGNIVVDIEQTADKAIANWESFNVGRNTIVQFDQASSDWAILNRVTDPLARPSQIQGQIRAPGTVLIVNRNGIVFSGSSQINTRNLVAGAVEMSDSQFTANGIYSTQSGGTYLPSFTNADGALIVEAGAQISTAVPGSVTQGGGYVLLMGKQVSNAGDIETRKGQIGMAAGDNFVIRKGVGTDGNTSSTTRGNEIAPNAGSTGQVINTGLLLAREGDVTLAGHDVQQNAVAVATTTVNTRGTIHLLNSASDAGGRVTLGSDAVTTIALEDGGATALDSQRAALIANSANLDLSRPGIAVGQFDNLSKQSDRQDQSRVEIVSGGDVSFEGKSLTLATGGQISVSAGNRSFAADGSILDVSGAVGVNLAMASNNVVVNVQGNELRDSPGNRDSGNLFNSNITIDRRNLILVPGDTGGDPADRWYTANGLLEVSGYLSNQGHSIGEWAAQGGTIRLGGKEVIAQTGSQLNLSGGSLNVATGYVAQTWLVGSDGNLYNADSAPADMTFSGVYKGFEVSHPRWGKDASVFFYNPLIAPQKRLENGYTVGRDAGHLIVDAPTSVVEGDIVATVFNGARQIRGQDALGDSYLQAQTAVARAATLSFGKYAAAGGKLNGANDTGLVVGNIGDITSGMAEGDALAADRVNTTWLDAGRLSAQGLGGLDLASSRSVAIDAPLALADGGALTVTAPQIDVDANITIHGGSVAMGNLIRIAPQGVQIEQWSQLPALAGVLPQVTIGAGSVLDLTGVWRNALTDPDNLAGLPYLNGGSLSVSTTGSIALAAGSLVDVSSGGAILSNGKLQSAKGGNVSLITNNFAHFSDAVWVASDHTAPLIFDGAVRAYGFNGGGTLTLSAPQTVVIGGAAAGTVTGPVLNLDAALFQSGFTAYDITGSDGVQIADGATLAPSVPVYRLNDATLAARSGSNIAAAADLWTPPVFIDDNAQGKMTRRAGADLTLVSTRGDFLLPGNAAITVDPGHAVNLYVNGQTTVEGDISAPGGNILIAAAEEQIQQLRILNGTGAFSLTRSIWIGGDAVLDVAGLGESATDVHGHHYGIVTDGGSIALGGANGAASDAFVIIRPGAVLDASGAAATIDVVNGNVATPTLVASDGGSIALNSNNGIYIDGMLRAAAGGAGAAGGTLSMNLVSRVYTPSEPDPSRPNGAIGTVPAALHALRNITITQQQEASGLSSGVQAGQADAGLLVGNGAISAEQIAQGGFGSLALKTSDLFVFKGDLNLSLSRSLTLAGGVLSVADATPDIHVALAAPYVRIDGFTENSAREGFYTPSLHAVLPSLQRNASSFSVAADLLDLNGGVRFGAYGVQGSGWAHWGPNIPDQIAAPGSIVDAAGFAQVSLASSGDIRLGNGLTTTDGATSPSGWIKTSGDLNLTAAQIYPVSAATISIYAGLIAVRNSSGAVQGSEGFDPAQPGTITIRRSGDAVPLPPASVFGTFGLFAADIDQGGVLSAPLGLISFNSSASGLIRPPVSSSLVFRTGSITSASANGLIMPFGGTTDGISYQGADGTLTDLGAARSEGGDRLVTGITVNGTSIAGEAGALLDVSGGGTLTGAGFVTGRGGSVDTLRTALVSSNPVYGSVSAKGDQVYAIMPGYASAYAPLIATKGAGDPTVGQQITIPAGVPGLAAGTYTLLPSSYALLPGAFRVEIGAQGTIASTPGALPNGSYMTSGIMSVANTGIRDALPTDIILSSGKATRSYSQYNETSYADFARGQAAQFGNVRPRLPDDGKILQFGIGASTGAPSLSFAGIADFAPVNDGIDGGLLITSTAPSGILDITAPGAAPVIGHSSVSSSDINAFHPASLFIGGAFSYSPPSTSVGGSVNLGPIIVGGTNSTVNVMDGADLHAGQIFVVAKTINVEGGATIDTRGQSKTGLNSDFGYVFASSNFIGAANGWLNFLPATGAGTGTSMTIASGASLLSEGTVVLGAPGSLSMGDVNFGARYLTVTQDTINSGDAAALANAQAAGVLSNGWTLSQTSLDQLLRPSTTAGTPALERLTLTAGGSVNLFGNVNLDARGQSGTGVEFVLNTPAIYGLGDASDTATIVADHLVWNGIRTGTVNTVSGVANYGSKAPAAILANGAGTGTGNLVLQAQDITLGYDEDSRPTDGITLDRFAVGFTDVALNASGRITANSDGTLQIGLARDSAGKLTGGNLTLSSPLVTAAAGSSIGYKAGGAIRVVAPAGVAPGDTLAVTDLGGTLSFNGDSVFADTAFALPSGKLTLAGINDVSIGSNARIDLAGRTVAFFDLNKYGWGGDLVLTSDHGSITQNAGALIDVSATYNQAGSIAAIADEGHIALGGTLRGSALAGNQSGSIGLRAQSFGDFAALNAMLSDAGFFESRSFVLRQGDLVVGDGVQAHIVLISVDNGSLTVNGRIDASGSRPGSIRLAAQNDLTLTTGAVLDTHGTQLQTDSYGAPIEADNTAHVDLTTAQGRVVLTPDATIDMASPDHALRGKLEINAPRLDSSGTGGSSATGAGAPANATGDDIAISAAGPLDIRGAASIAVNGFATYTNAPADPGNANGQMIDQAWLDLIHQDSTAFYGNALGNADLQNRLAGLKAYSSAFHLRPGVTIASATPDGDLTTNGDLDFSNYRYGAGADTVNHTGAGEVGVINFRAGGTLTVKGSINDGFAPPPVSPDALTTLLSGMLSAPYTVTTAGVVLGANWLLNVFDDTAPPVTIGVPLPLGDNFFFNFDPTVNHPLPIDVPLAADFTYGGFGDPLGGEIRAADGTVLYRATDSIPFGTIIPAGSVLGAGLHDIGAFLSGITTSLKFWPANTDLYSLSASPITLATPLPPGTVVPANFSLTDMTITGPGDRKVWTTSVMQAAGAQSWSMRLVGGADVSGADGRALRTAAALAAGTGNVVLSDPYTINLAGVGPSAAGVSVVRTGTGNLEILAGGSYRQDSPYGVYTAGTAIAVDSAFNTDRATATDGTVLGSIDFAQNADYEKTLKDAAGNYLPRMYYTENGGDFLLSAQGDIGGMLKPQSSGQVGQWLWRQGGAGLGQATAWGINFGSYVASADGQQQIQLAAFSGMGALGGGNVTLRAGGDIGNDGQGVVAAVGGSGRVINGTLVQTGGGTLTVKAGGDVGTGGNQFVNLRGDTQVDAGNFGSMIGVTFGYNGIDPRPLNPLQSFHVNAAPGGAFAPGDGTITVHARGDLVMGSIDDPGRVGLSQNSDGGSTGVQGSTWFTLWTNRTAVDLMAAGGDAVPLSKSSSTLILPSILRVAAASGSIILIPDQDGTDLMMPSPQGALQMLARGSIIDEFGQPNAIGPLSTSLASMATPLNPAWLTQTVNGGSIVVKDSNVWATTGNLRDQRNSTTLSGRLFAFGPDTIGDASALSPGVASSIYAVNGDITGLRYGEVFIDSQFNGTYINTNYYHAAKPVNIMAGGDIVNLGGMILHADPTDVSTIAAGGSIIYAGVGVSASSGVIEPGLQIAGPGTLEVTAGKNIYQGSKASIESIGAKVSGDTRPGADVVLQAGVGAGTPGIGQIDWAGFAERYLDTANVAGPGALAGQPGKVVMTYGDELTLAKWLHDNYDYTGNEADAPAFMVSQQGKLDAAHASEPNAPQRNLANDFLLASQLHLVNWLKTRYGSAAGALHYDATMDPMAFFQALPAAQQRVLLRDVYYAELTAGGREYNDAGGPRFGSYLRGRDAIAVLFPQQDAYQGDIRMFSTQATPASAVISASVHTDFGGDIQLLAPGGLVTIGTDGLTPGADSGLITQGAGNIQIYSDGSVLLGLSRIMTTFGGNILAWSATGDINAGRGSKTTVVFTPPRLSYDDIGDVALAPQVPSTGAGIATLNPIPEVPPGDVDLIAPLGTIDAGEAGIRVSGNVNLAALQVVNAANIQVQGKSTGLPLIATVNVNALTNASAAATQAAMAAQDVVNRERASARQALPSIFTVRVLGFGNEPAEGEKAAPQPAGAASRQSSAGSAYNAESSLTFVGIGDDFDAKELAQLSSAQRRRVQQAR